MNTIEDAIERAMEMTASYEGGEITIVLKQGVHSMLRDTRDFYIASNVDKWTKNLKMTIKSEFSSQKSTVLFKKRDTFKFKVGAGLTIENVIFDAVDSVIVPEVDTNCL